MTLGQDDHELRARAAARVRARDGFRAHLLVYVLVNSLLWAIWLVNGANWAAPWPIFPLLGWGIGLAINWYVVSSLNDARREAAIEREVEQLRGRRGG